MTIDHVTASDGNVFADLGLSRPEERLAKSRLAMVLLRSIREIGLTQTAAAKRLGVTQPKLSNILNGRLDGISEAYIAECLRKLGHDVDYRIGRRHEGMGRARVLETA
jgi:predicted XRE-type DNA-binding protein